MGWRVGGESQEWKSGSLGEATTLGKRTAAPLSWASLQEENTKGTSFLHLYCVLEDPCKGHLGQEPWKEMCRCIRYHLQVPPGPATERQVQ